VLLGYHSVLMKVNIVYVGKCFDLSSHLKFIIREVMGK
jgi:hypothetical protein